MNKNIYKKIASVSVGITMFLFWGFSVQAQIQPKAAGGDQGSSRNGIGCVVSPYRCPNGKIIYRDFATCSYYDFSQCDSEIATTSLPVGDVDPNQTSTCLNLQSTLLRYKATDQMTGGEVTDLQDFLISVGFLKTQTTGYFGLGTFSAVKQFQKSVGLSASGYVGPLTKAKIKEMSCSGQTSETQTNQKSDSVPVSREIKKPTVVDPSSNPGLMVGCAQMDFRACPNGTPMKRDPATCQFIESSCTSTLPPTQENPTPVDAPKKRVLEVFVQPVPPSVSTSSVFIPQPKVMCTMEVKLCPDGVTAMARDSNCGWHPESCPTNYDQGGMQCTKDQTTAKTICGPLPPVPVY